MTNTPRSWFDSSGTYTTESIPQNISPDSSSDEWDHLIFEEEQARIAAAAAAAAAAVEAGVTAEEIEVDKAVEALIEDKGKGYNFEQHVLAIAKNALGEENASIDVNNLKSQSGGKSVKVLMLRWPYLEMVNRNGLTHTITEMYILLQFNIFRDRFEGSFNGTRGEYSHAEYVSNYMHSHQSGFGSIDYFCTGADGINDIWMDLTLKSYKDVVNYDMIFEGFIHQMTSFLRYESLEGVPHKKMSNISSRNEGYVDYRLISNVASSIMNVITPEDIDFSISMVSGKVWLNETSHLHNIMVMNTPEELQQIRLPNGEYVNADNTSKSRKEVKLDKYKFYFKKKVVIPVVKPITYYNEKQDTRIRSTNKRVWEKIKERLEGELGKIVKRELAISYTFKRKVQEKRDLKNRRKALLSNLVRIDPQT